MKETIKSEQLIIPVYINEKIVLDMLAIMEDGFSTASQIGKVKDYAQNQSAVSGE